MTVHVHTEFVDGCARCDLSRDDAERALPTGALFASRLMPPGAVDADEMRCPCGNDTGQDGFVPCTPQGVEVEPTAAEWRLPLWECVRCDAIILDDISGAP
jgi:hypothetical protein